MTLKVGKNGLGGEDDWTVKTGGDDDGEKGGSREVHHAIQKEAAVDVAVVVSRLYGGVMLGPVRFHHIKQVATQALQRLAHAQTIPPLVERLKALDEEIAQFVPASTKAPGHGKANVGASIEYEGMPIEKLERLTSAREKRLELLKKKFREEEEALWKEVEKQDRQGESGAITESQEEEVETFLGESIAGEQEGDDEEGIDAEEEALWAALEAQAVSSSAPSGPSAVELGLPDEEDAAIGAATLSVARKKREKEADECVPAGMGGGFLLDE